MGAFTMSKQDESETETSSGYITIDTSFMDNYTIDTSTYDFIDNNSITPSTYDWNNISEITTTMHNVKEFEDVMPNLVKIEQMCNQYPALRQAYENFKSIYELVNDDWESRTEGGA